MRFSKKNPIFQDQYNMEQDKSLEPSTISSSSAESLSNIEDENIESNVSPSSCENILNKEIDDTVKCLSDSDNTIILSDVSTKYPLTLLTPINRKNHSELLELLSTTFYHSNLVIKNG